MKNPIYPCLWFDGKAKEAAEYYCAIFQNSKILSESPIVVIFELNGNRFMGLNGGPMYTFSEATSFVITCENQTEIDHYWSALTAEGKEGQCGWLKDKYGVSWQVVPSVLPTLMADPERSQRVIAAYIKMKKFNIAALENA